MELLLRGIFYEHYRAIEHRTRVTCNGVLQVKLLPFIGYVAGFLTTVSFLPQVVRTVRTRSAKDLSWGMLLLFYFGVILWLIYGIKTDALPIIVANGVTLFFSTTLIICKFIFRKS